MRAASLIIWTMLAFLSLTAPARAEVHNAGHLADAQRALVAWYDCIECVDFELERLLKYRDVIEGALISTLNNGLSPAKRAEIEEGLRRSYRPTPDLNVSQDGYVAFFTRNADASYRKRAAIALGRLNTDTARQALRAAANNPDLRADVRTAAEQALSP